MLVGEEVHQRTFGTRLGPSADRVSQYKEKLPQVFCSCVGQVLYILVGIYQLCACGRQTCLRPPRIQATFHSLGARLRFIQSVVESMLNMKHRLKVRAWRYGKVLMSTCHYVEAGVATSTFMPGSWEQRSLVHADEVNMLYILAWSIRSHCSFQCFYCITCAVNPIPCFPVSVQKVATRECKGEASALVHESAPTHKTPTHCAYPTCTSTLHIQQSHSLLPPSMLYLDMKTGTAKPAS